MQLYYAKGTIAIAIAIALEEAAIPYEARRIEFGTGDQQAPDYLAINPKGRVPALILEDGTILTETGALLDYLAAIKPEAGLLPADPLLAAHARAVTYYLASTMHVAHAHKMRGSRWADEETSFADMKRKVPQTMTACAAYVEEEALRGDYVTGDSLSLADPYLFIACNWLEGDGVDLSAFPRISAYLARMEARESVKAMRARDML